MEERRNPLAGCYSFGFGQLFQPLETGPLCSVLPSEVAFSPYNGQDCFQVVSYESQVILKICSKVILHIFFFEVT